MICRQWSRGRQLNESTLPFLHGCPGGTNRNPDRCPTRSDNARQAHSGPSAEGSTIARVPRQLSPGPTRGHPISVGDHGLPPFHAAVGAQHRRFWPRVSCQQDSRSPDPCPVRGHRRLRGAPPVDRPKVPRNAFNALCVGASL